MGKASCFQVCTATRKLITEQIELFWVQAVTLRLKDSWVSGLRNRNSYGLLISELGRGSTTSRPQLKD